MTCRQQEARPKLETKNTMKQFTIKKHHRLPFVNTHRWFQAAVATVANEKMGTPTTQPKGIFKTEGGVVVNGREIVIHQDFVQDDWATGARTETPEEVRTVEAIQEVLDGKHNGLYFPKETLVAFRMADPLRRFFDDCD